MKNKFNGNQIIKTIRNMAIIKKYSKHKTLWYLVKVPNAGFLAKGYLFSNKYYQCNTTRTQRFEIQIQWKSKNKKNLNMAIIMTYAKHNTLRYLVKVPDAGFLA